MRKVFLLIIFPLIFFFFLPVKNHALANCSATYEPTDVKTISTIVVKIQNTIKDHLYWVDFYKDGAAANQKLETQKQKSTRKDETLTFNIVLSKIKQGGLLDPGTYWLSAQDMNASGKDQWCFGNSLAIPINITTAQIPPPQPNNPNISGTQPKDNSCSDPPVFKGTDPEFPTSKTDIKLKFDLIDLSKFYAIIIDKNPDPSKVFILRDGNNPLNVGSGYMESVSHSFTISPINPPQSQPDNDKIGACGSASFNVVDSNSQTAQPNKPAPPIAPPPPPCKTWEGEKCVVVDTAIGDFNTDPAKFAGKLMGIILGLSGGIAVLLIIISGYRFMASQGNPEKVQGAKESLTSAIVGLLFIIFSIVILQIIGINILNLPGWKVF